MASIDDLKSKLSVKDERLDERLKEKRMKVKEELEFKGARMEDVLEEASDYFGEEIINLDYDVIEKPRKGILGLLKRPYKVKVWVSTTKGAVEEGVEGLGIDKDVSKAIDKGVAHSEIGDVGYEGYDIVLGEDIDEGLVKSKAVKKPLGFIITVKREGILLNVEKGADGVTEGQIKEELSKRNIKDYAIKEVRASLKSSRGKAVKIGEWQENKDFDSKATLTISQDKQKAYLNVRAPVLAGRELEKEEIYALLEGHGVRYGIKGDRIEEILGGGLYNQLVVVAEGQAAKHGSNARIEYKFKTEQEGYSFVEHERTGKVDYKKLDLLENVVAGQVLAVKLPLERGEKGKTVFNETVECKDGEDIELEIGENVSYSGDMLTVRADISGRVVLKGGVISVEEVYYVEKDVDLTTGNIVFLGTVIVKGSVRDGFSVKAAGNIEVSGSVGSADLEADGEIIVSQGILGKDRGSIKAGSNVFAKFIENARVYAGNDVIVKEEILHSNVDGCGRVICSGKKGAIVGGQIRAGYTINAKTLGSHAYTQTNLEAGLDPKSKDKLINLEEELDNTNKQLEKVVLNIETLTKRKAINALNEGGDIMLKRLDNARHELELQLEEIKEDIEELTDYLSGLANYGKISGRVTIHPGVYVNIKNATLLVRNEFKHITFVNENDLIKPIKYEGVEGEEG